MAKWLVHVYRYEIKYKVRTMTIKSQALVDFVADFSPNLQTKAGEVLLQLLEQTINTLKELVKLK